MNEYEKFIAAADALRARWLNDGHELREPSRTWYREAVEAYDEARRGLERVRAA